MLMEDTNLLIHHGLIKVLVATVNNIRLRKQLFLFKNAELEIPAVSAYLFSCPSLNINSAANKILVSIFKLKNATVVNNFKQ